MHRGERVRSVQGHFQGGVRCYIKNGQSAADPDERRAYTSVATIHSTPMKAGFTTSSPPSHNSTSSGFQRIRQSLGAVSCIAASRSDNEMSRPMTFVWFKKVSGACSRYQAEVSPAAARIEFSLIDSGDGLAKVSRIDGGGGGSHGAGLHRHEMRDPSPHPTSIT